MLFVVRIIGAPEVLSIITFGVAVAIVNVPVPKAVALFIFNYPAFREVAPE
jgi:hypothetical protein